MKVKDFDSYRAPNRKPWGVLVVLLVVGGLVYWFGFRDAPEKPSKNAVKLEQEDSSESATKSGDNSDQSASVVVPPADVALMLDEAAQLAESGDLVEARVKYLVAMKHATDPLVRRQIERKVAPINIELVMTPRQMPEKEDYLVKSGDSLERIARRFGTTTELIQKSNMLIDPNIIKAGDRLRVFTGEFSMVASKSRHDLLVTMNGEFFKRYKVGTGKFGKTPVGTFKVQEKIPEPPWWRPDGKVIPFGDDENILGTRWLSLRATGETEDVRGYGIHGTWSPESVGSASSAGCLRMINEEVEELFAYIPLGTPVTIEE